MYAKMLPEVPRVGHAKEPDVVEVNVLEADIMEVSVSKDDAAGFAVDEADVLPVAVLDLDIVELASFEFHISELSADDLGEVVLHLRWCHVVPASGSTVER